MTDQLLTIELLPHPDPGYVACPHCGVGPGPFCETATGGLAAQYHRTRRVLAMAQHEAFLAYTNRVKLNQPGWGPR